MELSPRVLALNSFCNPVSLARDPSALIPRPVWLPHEMCREWSEIETKSAGLVKESNWRWCREILGSNLKAFMNIPSTILDGLKRVPPWWQAASASSDVIWPDECLIAMAGKRQTRTIPKLHLTEPGNVCPLSALALSSCWMTFLFCWTLCAYHLSTTESKLLLLYSWTGQFLNVCSSVVLSDLVVPHVLGGYNDMEWSVSMKVVEES